MQNKSWILPPSLNYCLDRSKPAQNHPTNGSPNIWFSNDILGAYNKSACGFHFFVNHNVGDFRALAGEVWLKQISTAQQIAQFQEVRTLLEEHIAVMSALRSAQILRRIGEKLEIPARVAILPEPCQDLQALQMLFVTLADGDKISNVDFCDYITLTNRILEYSGDTKIRKELTIADTDVKCKLSRNLDSEARWPTDADCVVMDESGAPALLLEFKKDTKKSSLEKSALGIYYSKGTDNQKADNRKYNNLALLRDGLGGVPFVVLYYSVRFEVNEVKLELLDGHAGDLSAVNSKLIAAPTSDISTHKQLVEEVFRFALL